MAGNLKKHLSALSRRGPHRVLVGDLDYVGLPGKIYVPAKGNGIPGVVFGHDWLTGINNYHRTLRHLASWGIAVAAPDTELNTLADHRCFSADMDTCLQVLAGVKLGEGNVTVSPGKLGLVGHGMGGGCAVLAAAGRDTVTAVVPIFPAATSPKAEMAARKVTATGLVIGSGQDNLFDAGNPAKLAYKWGGTCLYKEIDNGNQWGFSENLGRKLLLGLGLPQYSAQETIRGLVTGFLLHQLDEQSKYKAFSDPEATGKHIAVFSDEEIKDKADLEAVKK
ncbi:dienelactone hydrolase family protein [Corynebacterium mendelii]|uniref:Dienelactone hydrolase family protein n=1 Tax=Corynebacterium mendelii TaxID=2765362 RepID=A0A939E1E7_9CORY|nr:dienelactone hydrolase family protein [Corynebacterium mendelii]